MKKHRVRVYKSGPDLTLPPCWHWSCTCGWSGNGVFWNVGTWRGCMAGAYQHLVEKAS